MKNKTIVLTVFLDLSSVDEENREEVAKKIGDVLVSVAELNALVVSTDSVILD